MKRLYLVILTIIMLTLSACGSSNEKIPLNIAEETVDVDGFDGEFNIFFLADSHISLCDDRDSELIEKAAQRSTMFKVDDIEAWDRFDALIGYAKKDNDDLLILGGDIIDSAMYASIDHVNDRLKGLDIPYMYTMGNHDFEYGNEYFSPKAYEEYLPRLHDLRDDKPYQIREYDDLIVFSADDDNSQIDAPVLEAYKEEASKGKPIVLIVHVPIEPVTGDDSLTEQCKQVWGPSPDGRSRVTMGVNGCYPGDTTREFLDLVLADDSPVVLVLAGHVHFWHKDMLNDRIVQIVTGAAFDGSAVKVTLK